MISWSRPCGGFCAARAHDVQVARAKAQLRQVQSCVPWPWQSAHHDRARLQLVNTYAQLGWTSIVYCSLVFGHVHFRSEAEQLLTQALSGPDAVYIYRMYMLCIRKDLTGADKRQDLTQVLSSWSEVKTPIAFLFCVIKYTIAYIWQHSASRVSNSETFWR